MQILFLWKATWGMVGRENALSHHSHERKIKNTRHLAFFKGTELRAAPETTFPYHLQPEPGAGRHFSYENKLARSSLSELTSLCFTSLMVLQRSWVVSCHNSDDAPKMISSTENKTFSQCSSDVSVSGQTPAGSVFHILPTHFTLPFHNQNSPVLDSKR